MGWYYWASVGAALGIGWLLRSLKAERHRSERQAALGRVRRLRLCRDCGPRRRASRAAPLNEWGLCPSCLSNATAIREACDVARMP